MIDDETDVLENGCKCRAANLNEEPLCQHYSENRSVPVCDWHRREDKWKESAYACSWALCFNSEVILLEKLEDI